MRRVIRLDRRLPGLGLSVPHHRSYTIERERLFAFVDWAELELPPSTELPKIVILLSKPVDDEALDSDHGQDPLRRYWRLLFHACAHVELERRIPDQDAPGSWAAERRQQIGEIEFAEIRTVLLKDDYLFPTHNDREVYVEFAATYLELRYFAADELPLYFPAIRDWEAIDRIVGRDIEHGRVFDHTRLVGASLSEGKRRSSSEANVQPVAAIHSAVSPASLATFRKLQARADRAASVGNGIKAAIWQTRAAGVGPPEQAEEASAAAQNELKQFIVRLQNALNLSGEETNQWLQALEPLLTPAAEGFWSNEARLLYDLQKVCVERERGVYKLDLVEWVRTWGQRPVRRPLPLLREVLITRRLRTANRRLAAARMNAEDRDRLALLLSAAVNRSEYRLREEIRPHIVNVLDEVQLEPQNIPERVARRKLVEELLDRVVEHGYVTMGDLRDSLSKNDLKLPDVSGIMELIVGDQLLRADRKFDRVLDGVYRRGAIYLRWPQTLSSLAFGTNFGRFLTQYVAIPFGGAYLTLEFLRHYAATLSGHGVKTDEAPTPQAVAAHTSFEWPFYSAVFVLGVWFLLLLHRPAFRAWNLAVLQRTWQGARKVLVDLPTSLLHSPLVQHILNSQTYAAIQSYLLQPVLVTLVLALPAMITGRPWSGRLFFEVYLVVALVLNSSIGRYITEVISDGLVRTWHELRMRVFAAIFQWIMDVFHGLLVALERVVYSVDEWLRFRAGDGRAAQTVKLVAGVAWFFVAYVVVFVFTLLVEPQLNPIKHFPVVTVSHKILWTSSPLFVSQLSPYLGAARANALVLTTIWLIPGVFGFLVWELKENWRLYAANRPKSLRPASIGKHGETMVRLLRPGFHSGTLPKTFAALRRAARKAEKTGDWKPVNRRWSAVQHVEEAVRHFLERELLSLLEETDFLPGKTLSIGEIRAATNRLDVELHRSDKHGQPVILTWEEDAARLTATITQTGWLDSLSPRDRDLFLAAMAGLLRRSGIDAIDAAGPLLPAAEISWDEWTEHWSQHAGKTGTTPPVEPAITRAG